MKKGESLRFDYTGSIQQFVVPEDGLYQLEAYGAQGGSIANGAVGGRGGYAKRHVLLSKGTIIYICVGNQPTSSTGGYNGGGTGNSGARGGGGATHFASKTGTIQSIGSSNKSSFYCIAGGGGGGASGSGISGSPYSIPHGGAGGGTSGSRGVAASYDSGDGGSYAGGGASQSSGGSGSNGGTFGKGGNSSQTWNGGGGGGGLYGGGAGGNYNGSCGGGGGSGYMPTSSFTYKGTTYTNTMTSGSRAGNGYALITLLVFENSYYGYIGDEPLTNNKIFNNNAKKIYIGDKLIWTYVEPVPDIVDIIKGSTVLGSTNGFMNASGYYPSFQLYHSEWSGQNGTFNTNNGVYIKNGGDTYSFYTVRSKNPVDLTNYSKIKIHVNSFKTYFYFGVVKSITQGYTFANRITFNNAGDFELDVSNLTGQYYIVFYATNGGEGNIDTAYLSKY